MEKLCQVNLQASCSRDVLYVHDTKEKQDAMRTNHQHTHIPVLLALRQKVISGAILFFLFKQFTTTNGYLRDVEQLGDSHLTGAWTKEACALKEELACMGHHCSHNLYVLPVLTKSATASG